MKTFAIFLVLGLLLSTVGTLASDPDIIDFYVDPDDPNEDEYFDIVVEVEDDDGIDRVKLYVDGNYEATEYCDGDLDCTVVFSVKENSPGYYDYEIRVYDEDGDMESDEIRVYVSNEDSDNIIIRSFSATPNNPYVGTTIELYVRAEYGSDLDKIKFYDDGNLEETAGCHDEDCEKTFTVTEYSSGYHTYRVKVYAEDGEIEDDEITIFVRQPFNMGYCGNGICDGSESVSSCPGDCGSACTSEGQTYSVHPASLQCCAGLTVVSCASPSSSGTCQSCVGASVCTRCGNGICGPGENYCNCPSDCSSGPIPQPSTCGNGICSGSESCASCPSDCGTCAGYCGDGTCSSRESCSSCSSDCGTCRTTIPTIIYTCEQRGGECCDDGKGAIDGAADCPLTCFSSCSVTPVPAPQEPDGPTGAVIAVDSSMMILGLMVVILILLVLILLKK